MICKRPGCGRTIHPYFRHKDVQACSQTCAEYLLQQLDKDIRVKLNALSDKKIKAAHEAYKRNMRKALTERQYRLESKGFVGPAQTHIVRKHV